MTPPAPGWGPRRSSPGPLTLRHRRKRRDRATRRGRRRRLAALGATLTVVMIALLVAGGFGGAAAFESSCELSSLRPVAIGQNSFVYAADGSLLGSIPAERNRQPVPLRAVSAWMPKATVAIEDRRFYEHGGVDAEGIGRALWADFQAGKVVQGGSTITQQLVRNLYPVSRKRTLSRKLTEACLAIKLSRSWTKGQILGSYMNQVYYGNHAYGIEAAAQTYFSRRARNLTLPQAALIAGLPQAPSDYNPFGRPDRALVRRDEVLRAMLGTGAITSTQYADAVSDRELRLKPGRLYTRIHEPYFFGYVRDQLIAAYGAQRVRAGGLRVYTTIDRRFQKVAREAITETLPYSTDPAAALVAINPENGAIRAMTAVTPGRKKYQFNLVAQARRQAGSTFKTFVLTAAVAQGVNPATTTYTSAPFRYQPDENTPPWEVQTYDHSYIGATTIERATLRSDNTVFAQLTLDVGPANVASMARRLGVRTPLLAVPSIGLGSIAVSPLEMASAYATLAAGGVYSRPLAIRRVILPNGKEDTEAGWGEPVRSRVIPDGVAYAVTKLLEENVLRGTGVGAYFGRPAAGKTGTTENNADAWFCGYTPNLEATVWVGYPRAEIPMTNVHGIAVAGGTFPATIWKLFMERTVGRVPSADFPQPREYVVWKPFERGHYSLRFTGSTDAETSATTTEATTTSATTTAKSRPSTASEPSRPAPASSPTVSSPTARPERPAPEPPAPEPPAEPAPSVTTAPEAPPLPPTTVAPPVTEPPPPPPTVTVPPPPPPAPLEPGTP